MLLKDKSILKFSISIVLLIILQFALDFALSNNQLGLMLAQVLIIPMFILSGQLTDHSKILGIIFMVLTVFMIFVGLGYIVGSNLNFG